MGWRYKLESVFGGSFRVLNKMDGVRRCNSMESEGVLLDEDNYYVPVSDGDGESLAMSGEVDAGGEQDGLETTNREAGRAGEDIDEVTGPSRGVYRGRRGVGGYLDLATYERQLQEDKVEEMKKNTSCPICIYPTVDKVTCEDVTIFEKPDLAG